MPRIMINFGIGMVIGGLALSACWGWLWLIIGTVGVARGVCSLRMVMNSLIVGISPLLLGWGIWWMRAEAFSPNAAFVAGIFVIPLLLTGLSLRPASDGRPMGLHMLAGMRRLKDELLAKHHECGDCGSDHGAGSAEESP
jgi:hypothetical protein